MTESKKGKEIYQDLLVIANSVIHVNNCVTIKVYKGCKVLQALSGFYNMELIYLENIDQDPDLAGHYTPQCQNKTIDWMEFIQQEGIQKNVKDYIVIQFWCLDDGEHDHTIDKFEHLRYAGSVHS